eukprot:gnl/Chilomastix_cuspidata/239.p1 GENE.gnl/Chilomastix_cuspidata/239~~gnl/Chilomastix_cuspidata/239.p1  ORF type:complete len:577 (-),score=58.92 gnl/Chilomastix_cuspidata/239:1191-2921(-)
MINQSIGILRSSYPKAEIYTHIAGFTLEINQLLVNLLLKEFNNKQQFLIYMAPTRRIVDVVLRIEEEIKSKDIIPPIYMICPTADAHEQAFIQLLTERAQGRVNKDISPTVASLDTLNFLISPPAVEHPLDKFTHVFVPLAVADEISRTPFWYAAPSEIVTATIHILFTKRTGQALPEHKYSFYPAPLVWNAFELRKAIITLAQVTKKRIEDLTHKELAPLGFNKLTLEDALRLSRSICPSLGETFESTQPVDMILEAVVQDLRSRIVIPPGVSASLASDECQCIFSKGSRVLIFSPHADDDAIGMGAFIRTLSRCGCDIHVAYCVTGAVAVPDRCVEYSRELVELGVIGGSTVKDFRPFIRQAEARSALRVLMSQHNPQSYFLELPFYDNATRRPTEIDINNVYELLVKLDPQHIFMASDLGDPHFTHETSYHIVQQAVKLWDPNTTTLPLPACFSVNPHYEAPHRAVASLDCPYPHQFHFYISAWGEFAIYDISIFHLFPPDVVEAKTDSILCHQSQHRQPLFGGSDSREFWARARDRNRALVEVLSSLGVLDSTKYVGWGCESFSSGLSLGAE